MKDEQLAVSHASIDTEIKHQVLHWRAAEGPAQAFCCMPQRMEARS